MHKKIKRRLKKFLQIASRVFMIGLAFGFIALGGFLIWLSNLTLPNLDSFSNRQVSTSTKIFDRTGEVLLFDFHEEVVRILVTGDEISEYAKKATVAIEDSRFYEHKGIEIQSIARAVLTNMKAGNLLGGQGGSTITQQVIKNALLTREKKVSRKAKEWVLSLKLEQEYTKEEILALYLNEIPYGGTIYGIEQASQSFFGKNAIDLSLAEASYLAAIPQRPTFYSPFGNNRDQLDQRKNLVIEKMYEQGMITREEAETAKLEVVEFLKPKHSQNIALHFVQYVREYLENKYGQEAVLNDGLRVITTLDFELQQQAEQIVFENALENEESFNASNQSLVAIEAKTGHIITMVGSRNYSDTEIDGNFNVAIAQRQPGSSFKPFVYVTAFDKGYPDTTILFDTKTQFSTARGCSPSNLSSDGDCYSPNNYDNQEKGPISLRNALAQSRNIPAVKLLYLVGIQDAINTARVSGVTSLKNNPSFYGLTLVLGGGEVSLLDMTSAYTTFANHGTRVSPVAVIRVEDHDGNILEESFPDARKVLNTNAVSILNDVLSDNEARTPLFGSRSFMFFGDNVSIAAKTGTTNDNRDAWLIGYSTEIAVGVWSGNNDNSPMLKGSSISGKTWRAYFDIANKKYPPKPFIAPEKVLTNKAILEGNWLGGEYFTVDKISGKLATEFTPEKARQNITVINPRSILHWVNPSDPLGPAPTNPNSNPQYERWEYGVRSWLEKNNPFVLTQQTEKPTEYDDVHTADSAPVISIKEIPTLRTGNTIYLNPEIQSKYSITSVSYYLNNKLIGISQQSPFNIAFIPNDEDIQDTNVLKIIAEDSVLHQTTLTVNLPK